MILLLLFFISSTQRCTDSLMEHSPEGVLLKLMIFFFRNFLVGSKYGKWCKFIRKFCVLKFPKFYRKVFYNRWMGGWTKLQNIQSNGLPKHTSPNSPFKGWWHLTWGWALFCSASSWWLSPGKLHSNGSSWSKLSSFWGWDVSEDSKIIKWNLKVLDSKIIVQYIVNMYATNLSSKKTWVDGNMQPSTQRWDPSVFLQVWNLYQAYRKSESGVS